MIKIVESIHYHLWTDALHGRELARQAHNDWDRGTYVRWSIQSSWGSFEAVSGDLLGASNLGMRFRERFDEAVANKGLPKIDWGQGVWQRALQVYDVRKEFAHVRPTVTQSRLLTPVAEAEKAIAVLRDAIVALCGIVGVPAPIWVQDDADPGFDRGGSNFAKATVVRAGADENDPDTVRIAYVYRSEEHVCDILPPGTDHRPLLDDLIQRLNVPVTSVRAYRGSTLLEDRPIQARGA